VLQLGGVDADGRRVVGQNGVDAAVLRSDRLEGARNEAVNGPELGLGSRCAGLES